MTERSEVGVAVVVGRVSRKAKESNYHVNITTTAVNIINVDNDDDGAAGEGVNDSGGGGNIDYNIIDGGGGGNDVNVTSFFLSF